MTVLQLFQINLVKNYKMLLTYQRLRINHFSYSIF